MSKSGEDFVRQVAIGVCAMLLVQWLTAGPKQVVTAPPKLPKR